MAQKIFYVENIDSRLKHMHSFCMAEDMGRDMTVYICHLCILLQNIRCARTGQRSALPINEKDPVQIFWHGELMLLHISLQMQNCNQGCSPEDMDFYIEANFPQNFTQAKLLIAECVTDYYRTGELVVYDYVGKNYDQVEHHIKEFAVTEADLQQLMEELQRVQDPEHWLYQSRFRDETRREWLHHIQSVYQTLKEHT